MNEQVYLDKIADLEYKLQQILAYANETDIEATVAKGKAEFGVTSAYAYTTGVLGARLRWIGICAKRALEMV
jgi:hypothetical protein